MPPRSFSAFSLLELLIVVAAVSIMMTLTTVAVSSVTAAGAITKSVSDLASLIEQARSVAMAKNTYTWLGLAPATETGTDGVTAVVLWSPDGTGAAAAAIPLAKKTLLNQVQLNSDVPSFDESSRPTATQILRPEGGWLIFSPTGDVQATNATASLEALPSFAAGAAISRWIEIGLSSVHSQKDNEAALQVSGLSGKMMIYRR